MNTLFTTQFRPTQQVSANRNQLMPVAPQQQFYSSVSNFSNQQPNTMLFVLKAIIFLIQSLQGSQSMGSTQQTSMGQITAPPTTGGTNTNTMGSQGETPKKKPVDPFPPLLKVVSENEAALNISPAQKGAIEMFKSAPNHQPLCKKLAQGIRDNEQKLKIGFVTGMPSQQIRQIMNDTLQARSQIAELRLKCRDMLLQVLSPDQFQKLSDIIVKSF